jgi:hypothetical protein
MWFAQSAEPVVDETIEQINEVQAQTLEEATEQIEALQEANPTLFDNTESFDALVVSNTTLDANGGWLAFMALYSLVLLVVYVLMAIALWRVFEKAGEKGWKALIPFYNTYTLFRIAGRNGWGFLLMFIPFVNLITWIVVSIDLAKHFGKSTVFGIVGLWLFSVVGFFMLGFGDSKYEGPKHA